MSAPVTPCAPEAAVAFIQGLFGTDLAKGLDPSSRLATTRARRITELRRCGDLRHAERYGWLSLTGRLLGMKASTVTRLDPSSAAFVHRARSRDVLPDPLGEDVAPTLVTVGDTGLQVSDPRDPLGYRVLQLAIAAVRDGIVELDGQRVGGGAAAAALRERLGGMAHG